MRHLNYLKNGSFIIIQNKMKGVAPTYKCPREPLSTKRLDNKRKTRAFSQHSVFHQLHIRTTLQLMEVTLLTESMSFFHSQVFWISTAVSRPFSGRCLFPPPIYPFILFHLPRFSIYHYNQKMEVSLISISIFCLIFSLFYTIYFART